MIRLNDIIERVNAYLYLSDADVELLKKAYVYSAKVHAGQTRSSGEPYLSHPLEVSWILAEMKLDVSSIVTGLLHDTVEDTLATPEEIETLFGSEIAFLVDGVTKISQLPYTTKIERQAEGFRKLILATAKDIRVVLIKLADRLHNMRTLEYLKEDRQKSIAKETFDIYAPLAHRLGISWVTQELEDLSFKFLNPGEYQKLSKLIADRKEEWEQHVDEIKALIAGKLAEFDINAEVTGRFKHIYGIYRKMQTQNIEFDSVYDVIAFRIITGSLRECYEALGAVHSAWKPVPGRFKDYIALPKGNGYQSLHTTVIGPFGERMEIQIRTREMHNVAEYGVASHWKYKEGRLDGGGTEIYTTLRHLLEWKDIKDPTEYMEAIKGELISDVVYVFTPRGDLMELPSGATPVDFAYAVHTEVGNRCMRAIVSGKLVPLNHQLKTGDTVEIVTANDKHPNRDWLKFVVTSRAKTKIRAWLRNEERTQSEIVGKSICERKFKQHGLDFNAMLKNGELADALAEFRFKDEKELYLAVGYGKISANDFLRRVLPTDKLETAPEKESRIEKIIRTITGTSESGVLINGYSDVMIRFANCCSPLPGEPITGYITRGKGITIHKSDCPRLLDVDDARRIEVEWDTNFKGQRPARIVVQCVDRPGILSNITSSFSSSDINISKAEIHSTDVDTAVGTFDVVVTDLAQLENVMKSIKQVEGVRSVERMLQWERQ